MFADYAASSNVLLKELMDPKVAATKYQGWASSGVQGLHIYKLIQEASDKMHDSHLGNVGASLLMLSKKAEGLERSQLGAAIKSQIETLAAQPQQQQWASSLLNIVIANGSKQKQSSLLPSQSDENDLLRGALQFMDNAKQRQEWWTNVCDKSSLGSSVVDSWVAEAKSMSLKSTKGAVAALVEELSKEVKALGKAYAPCPDPSVAEPPFMKFMKAHGNKMSNQMKKVRRGRLALN